MYTWEDVETLAIWLEYNPREVRRLHSENQTLGSAAHQILTSFYDRTSVPNAKRWEMIRDALCEMNKLSAVIELGIDQLIQETVSEMGPEEIQKESQRLKTSASNFNEVVKHFGLILPEDGKEELDSEESRKENQRLKNAKVCQVCKDKDANQLFLPCAHLSSCSLFPGIN